MTLVVEPQQQGCSDDSAQADDGEDDERMGIIYLLAHSVTFEHLADEHGNEHETDVLDVVDNRVRGSQLFHGHDFGNGGPQGSRLSPTSPVSSWDERSKGAKKEEM